MRTIRKTLTVPTLVIILSLLGWPMAVALAGTFGPITVIDQTPTAPLANPVPSSFQPRYISGFGSDDSFTVFFEDRDAEGTISYASTTSGPTGFPASATATNIADTHFLVKDWPINIGGTDYAYRAWGSVGNNMDHHFYVSNDLTNWTLISTFTIPNASGFSDAHGWVYYGFHDVILLNGTYYAFAESNQSQTMIVRSANGDDVWEAFASIGGCPGWGPLELPSGVSYGWTPSGNFVDLGHDRGYGKIHVDPRDSHFYLAVNTAAIASLLPADLEAAFINPANWTWHDGTTGPASNPILLATSEHDIRECWVVPNTDPDADWVIVYNADFGSVDGGKALGYATLSPPLPPPTVVYVDDNYDETSCTADGHAWQFDCFDVIQDGIDAVSGSTVHVAPGTYNERVTINKSVDLRGAQYGVDPTASGARTNSANESIITEAGLSTPNPDVLVEIPSGVTNVTIDGFTLKGDPTNTTADTSVIRCWDDDITISNNIIDGKVGVLYKGADTLTVHRNQMVVNKNGVVVQPNPASNVTVFDNVFSLGSSPAGDESAIYMTACSQCSVIGNTATGFFNAKGLVGTNVTDLTVSGNTFTGNKDAISIWGNSTFIAISDNDLSNSVRHGINIKGQDITITSNEILNNGDVGINIARHVIDTERVEIHNNNIAGNTNYGVKIDTALVTEIVDATLNWWGAVDGPDLVGPGSGDAVSANVVFCPWLDALYLSGAPTSSSGLVSNLDTGEMFCSIQDAIDDPDTLSGHTIAVSAWTYDSSVETFPINVDKSLTLLGAQANVDPRPSLGGRTGDETIIDADESSSAVLRVVSASDVEINGFTITGGTGDMVEESSHANGLLFRYNILYDDLASSGDEAIQVKYSDGVAIEHNYAYNIVQDAFNLSASSNGVVRYNEAHDIHSENAAIYCYNATNIDIIGNLVYNVPNNDGIKLGDSGDGSTGGIVKDNEVHDVAEDGITIYASGVAVENNTIYNSSSENGALYLYGADNSTVTRNTIYNNDAIGLLIRNSSDVTVEGNAIHDNDDWDDTKYIGSAGIWLTADASNVVINNNCIADNTDFGARNDATTVVDAEYNWWGDASGPYHLATNPGGLGNAVSDFVDYRPWLDWVADANFVYTGPPQPATSVILEATLTDSTPAGIPGVEVDFYVDGAFVGSATTDASGVASLDIGALPAGIYEVYATAACVKTDPALLPVYDPSGGFVTGGGWIDSPAGAYMPGPEGTVVVTADNVGVDWSTNDTRYDGYIAFVVGPDTPPLGIGSLEMGTAAGQDKAQLFNYDHMGTSLADIEVISYATHRHSSSENSPDQYPAINIEIDYVGDDSSYATLVWEPVYAYVNLAVDTWQTWDTMAPSQTSFGGGWWSTKDIPGVCAFNCFVDWDTILQNNPDAKIRYGFGVNVGSGWNGIFTGAVDALTLVVSGDTIIYDFEPIAPFDPTGRATFGFIAKYKKGAQTPSGNTEFVFKAADLNFHSESYDWLVVNQGGANAQFKGSGTINGGLAPTGEEYKFMLWAGDGEPDTFRIKIWYEAEDDAETVVYDNGFSQAIAGGNIVIHTKKK